MSLLRKLSVAQRLALSFVAVILAGTLLLSLPMAHYASAPETTVLDHFFSAVSMVCVAGLSVYPIAEVYNGFGQVVAMLLIQIGGLGLVTLIAVTMMILKRRMNLTDQDLLQSALSRANSADLKGYLARVYQITFAMEAIAALLLMMDFIPRYGVGHGIFNAVFLAISAFCNAGLDNLGASSLQDFALNPLVNAVVAALIFSGGLGFAVWMDLGRAAQQFWQDKPRRLHSASRVLTNQSRLVLRTTGILLLSGTLLTWLMELNNPKTIGNLPFWQQGMVSFFQTVTMRSAGFSTVAYQDMHLSTHIIDMIQMVVGGAPGGTAGGLKVTTLAITYLLFKSVITGQDQVTFRHRLIASSTIKQTLTVLIFFFSVLLVGSVLLLQVEPQLNPMAVLFEAFSAITTIGLSLDVTAQLSAAGRLIIIALMFIGRVGPITVLLSLLQKKEKTIRYVPTDISVG